MSAAAIADRRDCGPTLLMFVRDVWRLVAFRADAHGGAVWRFIDDQPEHHLDDRDLASIDTRVAAELAKRQNQWRARAEANRRRKRFAADRALYPAL